MATKIAYSKNKFSIRVHKPSLLSKVGFPLDGIIRTKRLLLWSRGTQNEQYDWFVEFSVGGKVELDPTLQRTLLAEFDEK